MRFPVVVEHGGGGAAVAAPIARDILLRAQIGDVPPLELYPVSQRRDIEENAPPAADPCRTADALGTRRRSTPSGIGSHMSFLEYNVASTPAGWRKILHLNWALVLLLVAVAGLGFLMLFSVAGGSMTPWVQPQMQRFGLGLVLMFVVAMVPIWFWRNLSALAYAVSVILLLVVEFFGIVGMGAQRWIDLGFMRLQPSEMTKITLVMMLAAYYDWLDLDKTSRPIFVILPLVLIAVPVLLTLRQPDLGTALLLLMGGGAVMFLAGVHWAYFVGVIGAGFGAVAAVLSSRGTPWQLLQDYQYRRIDTFLDPSSDPLGAGYHITQSQIALGSGGWTGRGFMEGTQSRLNFLPEKHYRFHLHHAGRGIRLRRRRVASGALHSDPRLLHLHRDGRARPVRVASGAGDRGGLLPLLRGEHGDGDGSGACRGRAAAAGQLRGLGHAGPDGGLRTGAIGPCASSPLSLWTRPGALC